MLGLRRKTVRVVAHDPEWPRLAAAECAALRAAGGDLLLAAEHVGSTSVPGLAAKPILDLAIAVADVSVVPALVTPFSSVGYSYRGDGGDQGGHLFVKETAPDVRTVHVHLVAPDDPQWPDYLRFRDALRADAGLRARYEFLKVSLAGLFPASRRAYTASKDEFVRRALGGAGASEPIDMYDRIAPLYHLIYADFEASVRRQATELSALFASLLGPGPLAVRDVSCGIGTQALGLAALGHRVTASDPAPAAVRRAREEAERRGLAIQFAVSDMRECGGAGFDVILSADNSVPHLLDAASVLAAFRAFHRAARPGGVAVISVRDYEREDSSPRQLLPYGVRETEDGRVTVFQIREVEGDRVDLAMYFVTERDDAWPDVTVGRSRLWAVSIDRLAALLTEAGFEDVRRIDDAFFQPVLVGLGARRVSSPELGRIQRGVP